MEFWCEFLRNQKKDLGKYFDSATEYILLSLLPLRWSIRLYFFGFRKGSDSHGSTSKHRGSSGSGSGQNSGQSGTGLNQKGEGGGVHKSGVTKGGSDEEGQDGEEEQEEEGGEGEGGRRQEGEEEEEKEEEEKEPNELVSEREARKLDPSAPVINEAHQPAEILDSPPTDFSRDKKRLYLAKSRPMAEYYAKAARRMMVRMTEPFKAVVLQVHIRKTEVDKAVSLDGEEWKKFVFFNRSQPAGRIPKVYNKYITAPVLTGPPTASGSAKAVVWREKGVEPPA
ncbi:hypothetical protein BJ508DRAFT_304841 [Ascobolus immersus RN42]|uniref:Uncharacterized protein n=1 Tax=Ascobolus immersus RN42 TaxID=1160509 RepID=A0A3N4IBD2_ASCIM|nr:hypothetical protein BJ508DRAFT_304841 [Ascobolus immersus RN42]